MTRGRVPEGERQHQSTIPEPVRVSLQEGTSAVEQSPGRQPLGWTRSVMPARDGDREGLSGAQNCLTGQDPPPRTPYPGPQTESKQYL